MAKSFEAIVTSRSFTFVVGEYEQPFVVHEDALASLSPSLAGLMQGQMSESLNAQTKWRDVKANTFTAFVQFGYTGDYSAPTMILQELENPSPRSDAAAPADEDVAPPDDDYHWAFGNSKKDKKLRKAKAPPSPFESRTYTLVEPRSRFEKSCDPVLERGLHGNIYEVLLLHASLYVLADKWVVDGLKRLSLFKFHKSLTLLEPNVATVPDIVGLVRYVYSDMIPALDELRNLVCHFVSINATVMSEDISFRELLEEGGTFALDSWSFATFK